MGSGYGELAQDPEDLWKEVVMTNYGMSKYGWDIQGPSSQYLGIWRALLCQLRRLLTLMSGIGLARESKFISNVILGLEINCDLCCFQIPSGVLVAVETS